MIPDLLDGRASPFSRVHTFELNMDRPSSSFVIPPNVMAYLFSGSPAFDFHEWEGMKRVYKTSFINEKCNTRIFTNLMFSFTGSKECKTI